jgi:AcrR family transcriptional regulator
MSRVAPPAKARPHRDERAPGYTRRKPQRRGQLRVRSLLDSAATLFVQKGVDATTVDDIIGRAGIAKGTFYHHFESKAALLAALREDVIARFGEQVANAVDRCPKDKHWLRLNTWVRAAVDAHADMGPLHDIVFGGANEPARWTATGSSFMDNFVSLLTEGASAGVWSVENSLLSATLIFRGLLGVVDDIILAGGDPRSPAQKIAELAARMVSARRPAQFHGARDRVMASDGSPVRHEGSVPGKCRGTPGSPSVR